ncbi:FKBP-type peptidyl-prolyl cis-trans isomerase domain [Dillenia turbinata]|uniref:peptidylprolyl isomerase n=1 Tax=Dillenia turbinata TaxID=194707 RepID=A0AAN8VIE8_9MAGN
MDLIMSDPPAKNSSSSSASSAATAVANAPFLPPPSASPPPSSSSLGLEKFEEFQACPLFYWMQKVLGCPQKKSPNDVILHVKRSLKMYDAILLMVPIVTTESGLQYKDVKPSVFRLFFMLTSTIMQVDANYVAMVPLGQVFDSSLEKGQPYIFLFGSGQVIKGLDEGILSMRTGGKCRLYIPGSVRCSFWLFLLEWLAFPKGLKSAPGRPRVAPNIPVIFDVSLEYIPGLELDEE